MGRPPRRAAAQKPVQVETSESVNVNVPRRPRRGTSVDELMTDVEKKDVKVGSKDSPARKPTGRGRTSGRRKNGVDEVMDDVEDEEKGEIGNSNIKDDDSSTSTAIRDEVDDEFDALLGDVSSESASASSSFAPMEGVRAEDFDVEDSSDDELFSELKAFTSVGTKQKEYKVQNTIDRLVKDSQKEVDILKGLHLDIISSVNVEELNERQEVVSKEKILNDVEPLHLFVAPIDRPYLDKLCAVELGDFYEDKIRETAPYLYHIGMSQTVPSHVQEDLVGSGYVYQHLLRTGGVVHPGICDWLLRLLSYSENEHVPGCALRAIAIILGERNLEEVDALGPDFRRPDEQQDDDDDLMMMGIETENSSSPKLSTEWYITRDRFFSVLKNYGADMDLLIPSGGVEETTDKKREGEGGEKGDEEESISVAKELRETFPTGNLDFLLRAMAVCITRKKAQYTQADIQSIVRACGCLLLDPVSSSVCTSVQSLLVMCLWSLESFAEKVSLTFCNELLSVSPRHQHWVKIAMGLPVAQRREKYLRTSFSYCALARVLKLSAPTRLFASHPSVEGTKNNSVLGLVQTLTSLHSKKKISMRELGSALVFVDHCINKEEILRFNSSNLGGENGLLSYDKLVDALQRLNKAMPDSTGGTNPEITMVKNLLTGIYGVLKLLLLSINREAPKPVQKKITSHFQAEKSAK